MIPEDVPRIGFIHQRKAEHVKNRFAFGNAEPIGKWRVLRSVIEHVPEEDEKVNDHRNIYHYEHRSCYVVKL